MAGTPRQPERGRRRGEGVRRASAGRPRRSACRFPPRAPGAGLTLVELLVTLSILALLFALLIRPMSSALEIVNLGTARSEVDTTARLALRQITEELSQALYLRSNFSYLDPISGEVRAPQLSRIDAVLPDDVLESGLLRAPLLPEIDDQDRPLMVSYVVTLRDPFKLKDGLFLGHDVIENPYVLYRFQYPIARGLPDPELLAPDDPALGLDEYSWAYRYHDPLAPDQEPQVPPFDTQGAVSQSAVTGYGSDVTEALFLPREVRNEPLQAGEHHTRFSARQGNWIRPYQVNGAWLLSGSDPAARAFVFSQADGTPLYYLEVNNLPGVNPGGINGSTVGHVMVYAADSGQAVYDTSLYPMRSLEGDDPLFSPFACGVDWERGEILTGFENINPRTGMPYDQFFARGAVQYPLELNRSETLNNEDFLPEAQIIPGSVQVSVTNAGATRSYRVLESRGNQFLQPGPGECHVNLDPTPQGAFWLTFHFRPDDAWNPPAAGVITVRYRYRTHAPTFRAPAPPRWTANYWTRNAITAQLGLDLPVNATQLTSRDRQQVRVKSVIEIRNAQKRY